MSYFEAPPRSRSELRKFANNLRNIAKINKPWFPVIQFLETVLPSLGLDYKILDDVDFNTIYGTPHALYNLDERIIYIREKVYNGAVQGIGRDRFTITHEIAHAFLIQKKDIQLYRGKEKIQTYCDPEWQASCLAGEILIPYQLCRNMAVDEIAEKCGVSYDAACYQKKQMLR